MNLKLVTTVIALSLPLAGCGNKGSLVLPQNPAAEIAPMLPAIPSMGDALPLDGVPEERAPAPSDNAPPQTPATPPVPKAGGNGGNG